MIAVFIVLLIVFETLAYVLTTPRPQEQFFQVYVLGANRLAASYYPNNDSNIRIAESISWYVGVGNMMGSIQFVALRVKLGNSTISSPNETQALPSPAPPVIEFSRFIQNNETWEFPFVWQILNMSTAQGSTRLLALQVNNQTLLMSDSSALGGHNFRFIFELWVWDTDLASFQFGWFTENEHRVAWLQIWFNATSVG